MSAHSSITFVKKCLDVVGSTVFNLIIFKCCCPPTFLFLCPSQRFMSSGSCSNTKILMLTICKTSFRFSYHGRHTVSTHSEYARSVIKENLLSFQTRYSSMKEFTYARVSEIEGTPISTQSCVNNNLIHPHIEKHMLLQSAQHWPLLLIST